MGRPSLDIIGKTFNDLTVVKQRQDLRDAYGHSPWECTCVCGNIVIAWTSELTRRLKRNCGCLPPKTKWADILGKKFGRLTVKSWTGGGGWWLCDCDCGTTDFRAQASRMVRGTIKGCGCVSTAEPKRQSGKYPPLGESGFRRLIVTYRKNAVQRGYMWLLDTDTARRLFTGNCYYCGACPSRDIRGSWNLHPRNNFRYNGIDRLDNTVGYVLGNVVSCCVRCNQAKHTMAVTEFKTWITAVHSHLLSKGEIAV